MKKILLCAFTALMFGFESEAMNVESTSGKPPRATYQLDTVPPFGVIQSGGKLSLPGYYNSSVRIDQPVYFGIKMHQPLVINGTDSVAIITAALKNSFQANIIVTKGSSDFAGEMKALLKEAFGADLALEQPEVTVSEEPQDRVTSYRAFCEQLIKELSAIKL